MEVINIKFHENPSNGSRADTCLCTDGRTDGHDEAKRRVPKLTRTCLKTEPTEKKIYPEEWNMRTLEQT
jgi:hypothetical protein